MGTEKLLLKISEAAALLGVSRSKCYELIQRGDLRTVRIDSAPRITRAEIEAFVQRLQQEAAATPSAGGQR